jgi:hypothetical protein
MVDPNADSMAAGLIAALSDDDRRATVTANARALYQERYSRPVYEARMKRLLELVGMGEPAASGGRVSAVTRPQERGAGPK